MFIILNAKIGGQAAHFSEICTVDWIIASILKNSSKTMNSVFVAWIREILVLYKAIRKKTVLVKLFFIAGIFYFKILSLYLFALRARMSRKAAVRMLITEPIRRPVV